MARPQPAARSAPRALVRLKSGFPRRDEWVVAPGEEEGNRTQRARRGGGETNPARPALGRIAGARVDLSAAGELTLDPLQSPTQAAGGGFVTCFARPVGPDPAALGRRCRRRHSSASGPDHPPVLFWDHQVVQSPARPPAFLDVQHEV